jgi:hypothetical protein
MQLLEWQPEDGLPHAAVADAQRPLTIDATDNGS